LVPPAARRRSNRVTVQSRTLALARYDRKDVPCGAIGRAAFHFAASGRRFVPRSKSRRESGVLSWPYRHSSMFSPPTSREGCRAVLAKAMRADQGFFALSFRRRIGFGSRPSAALRREGSRLTCFGWNPRASRRQYTAVRKTLETYSPLPPFPRGVSLKEEPS
jgi:hypothetical protein